MEVKSLSSETEAVPHFKVPKPAPPPDDGKRQNKQSFTHCIPVSHRASNFPRDIDQMSDPVTMGSSAVHTGETGSTSRDTLNDRAQQLIDKLNEKRKKDATLLAEFKKSLEDQAASAYSAVEQGMVQMYEKNSKIVQEKVQELFAVLDRIDKQEEELHRFKNALGMLYSDVREP